MKKTSWDRYSIINIPSRRLCYLARRCLGSGFTRLPPQGHELPCATSAEHPWHLIHGQHWACSPCYLQLTHSFCKERSKGHRGCFISFSPATKPQWLSIPPFQVPVQTLSHQPSGGKIQKKLLGGTSVVLSSRCLQDSTLNKTQRPLLVLILALVFCCSARSGFFSVSEI